jgi:hypothetical protein
MSALFSSKDCGPAERKFTDSAIMRTPEQVRSDGLNVCRFGAFSASRPFTERVAP